MACYFQICVFFHLLAWQLLPMGALSPRRRRCSAALQRVYRVLAAAFFDGLVLWHRGTTRSASSASFLPILFWQGRKEWARGATAAVLPHQRKSGEYRKRLADRVVRPCRVRRRIGCGATVAASPQIRHLWRQPEKARRSPPDCALCLFHDALKLLLAVLARVQLPVGALCRHQ